ncbi:hypothetical protein PAPHI01_0318 [Pancytospora philotis]|nr:hypothetical protein PAPHI01_0318 [Pancytospora philotis]
MLFFFVNVVICAAVLYNIHHSMKHQDKPSRKFYKHYFIVLALLLTVDNALSFILHRIPYYLFFKLSLLLWLSVPKSTGPHFIYNVYIKNIYKLFEGDIDAVIANLRGYVEQLKAKYHAVVNQGKKGELSFSFKNKRPASPGANDAESSEVDASLSVADEEEMKENKKTASVSK